jgi:aminoglycoside phosphotransferase (APT) family kinase protein
VSPQPDLAAALGRLLKVDDVTLHPLTTGTSRQTFAVSAGGRRLVLQQRAAGDGRDHLPVADEARLLLTARSVGVPVPEVVAASDDPAVLGSPFTLTEHVAGESIPRRILRDPELATARERLAAQLGAAIGRLQSIPAGSLPDLAHDDALDQLRGQADELRLARPAMELGFEWLTRHRPPPGPPTLVHGDLRLGNLLVDRAGVTAILDWELAHIGDPAEDLGWLCVPSWRFGRDAPVGGFGTVVQLLSGYGQVRPDAVPDLDTLRWWIVLGCLRWGVICARQAQTFLDGEVPSHELAVIGRRIAETEHDVLVLIGAWDGGAPPAVTPVPAFDVPAAPDLLRALDTWVAGLDLSGAGAGAAYGARVARTVIATLSREATLGPALMQERQALLAGLGVASEVELARAIRTGAARERAADVAQVASRLTAGRLAVNDPGYRGASPDRDG